MQSIDTVMDAIAKQITRESGVRASDVVLAKLNLPEVFLNLTSSKPSTFGGTSLDLTIDVIAFVSTAVDRNQRILYRYVSSGTDESLFDALAADPTFGLEGVSSSHGESRQLGIDEIAAYSMFGGAIELAVSIS